MITLGAATKVESAEDLLKWFKPLREDAAFLKEVSNKAKEYTSQNQGATALIMKTIFN
jgi:hypothetical protein